MTEVEVWSSTPPGPLYGKRIVRAWKEKIGVEYDDEPYYCIELESGEVFRFAAGYGSFTGDSCDEYPKTIVLQKLSRRTE